MSGAEGHSITPNPKAAFTIIYRDKIGELLFSLGLGNDSKILFLNGIPSQGGIVLDRSKQTENTQNWIKTATTRISAHYQAMGLKVQVE